MEKLELLKTRAVEAYNAGTEEQKELLRNLYGQEHFYRDPKEWVKTMADVHKAAGGTAGTLESMKSIDLRERLIMQVFNKNADGTVWQPDWSNPRQQKWRIVVQSTPDSSVPRGFRLSFYGSAFDVVSARLGCRHACKSEELAEFLGKNRIDLYEAMRS